MQKNQQQEANTIVQQLLREIPNDIELLVSAAQICENLNDHESAVRYYFRLSKLNLPEQLKKLVLKNQKIYSEVRQDA